MVNTIFFRTLHERKTSTLISCFAMLGVGLLFTGLYESVSSDISQFTESIPEGFNAFVGDIGVATSPAGWLSIEFYSLFLPVLISSLGVGFGAAAIGREEESGTLELLLASPISRRRIILEKAAAIATHTGLVAGAAWLGVVLGTMLFSFDVSLTQVLFGSVAAWLLGLFFGFFTLAAQAIVGKRGVGFGIGIGLLGSTYIANIVAQLVDSLDGLKYISPFYYYDIQNLLLGNPTAMYLVGLFVCAILFYVVANIAFTKRDTGI